MTTHPTPGGFDAVGRRPPAGVVCARLAILVEDRILLASDRGAGWFYLPGGAVEPGEPTDAALRREIREETGLAAESMEFVGCVEDLRTQAGSHRYELNLVFAAVFPRRTQVASREDAVDITSVAIADLAAFDVRPAALPALLAGWLHTRRPSFHGLPAG